MNIRKVLSIILTLCMILSCIFTCGISVSASTAYTVYSDSNIQATAGQAISVPVRISNNSGLMGYDMSFTYDDKVLTPVSVTRGAIMTDGFFEDDIEGTTSTDTSFRVFWSHAYPSTENGIMFYLNFNVDSKAMGSTAIQIGYDESATFDGDFDDVTLNCSAINIAITNNEYGNNPILTLSGNNISAGEQLSLDIFAENIGNMNSVKLTVSYDSANFKYSGMTVNGVKATAADSGSNVAITISSFTNKTDGKKITLIFQSESFATSGQYAFSAAYSDLSGVDRILIRGTEITVNATESSDSIVIYTDDEIKTEFGEQQLIVPLYIKHNTGLMGYTLTFNYDPSILEAVSAQAGSIFSGSFSHNIGREAGKFTCLWFANDDVTVDGDFITLTFNVITTQETNGQINISYNEKDIISESADGVRISVPNIDYTVNEVLLSSISVKQLPDNTTYFVGQALDTTGLLIELHYNDGSSQVITSDFTTSGFDSTTAGTKTVTVTYQGKTTTFTVTVKQKSLTQISVSKQPTKTSYFIGQELDTAGLQLKAEYDDGSNAAITSGFTTSGFDSTTAGTKTVTVTYQGKTTTFTVTVKQKSLTKISVSKQPTKISCFIGQELDTAGLQLKAEYDDGSNATITSGFTTSGFDSTTAGTKTVTVTYQSKTTTFTVTVKEKSLISISVNRLPDKTTYIIEEELDLSGLEVKLNYDDGSFDIITTGFSVDGFDKYVPETKVITITYMNLTTTFNVEVIMSPKNFLGDVDGDGEVTIIDATYIQRQLASIPTPRFNQLVADTDGDGSLTIIDATYIQRWLANLSSNENIGKTIKT